VGYFNSQARIILSKHFLSKHALAVMLSEAKHPMSLRRSGLFDKILRLRSSNTQCWDSEFLRFAQDFGRRLARRLAPQLRSLRSLRMTQLLLEFPN
jgi:hypothetical protein